MASKAPQSCCTEGVKREGEPVGSLIDIGDINTYVTGDKSSSKVLLMLTDVLGHKFVNGQLVADSYAKEGYYVVVPDLFKGDPTQLNGGIPDGWFDRHGIDVTEPIVKKTLEWIRSEIKPKFVASIGYCFGAKYTVRLLDEGAIDVGAAAHPSFVTIDETKAIKKPLIILAAENDQIFTPELREKSLEVLAAAKATYYLAVSSGVSHGFAVRGDPKDKWVQIAQDKAFNDSLWWFKLFEE